MAEQRAWEYRTDSAQAQNFKCPPKNNQEFPAIPYSYRYSDNKNILQ